MVQSSVIWTNFKKAARARPRINMKLLVAMYPSKEGHRDAFFETFKGVVEMSTPKLTRKVNKSSLYNHILPLLEELNRGSSKVMPGLKLFTIVKTVDVEGRTHTTVKRNPRVMIEIDDDFYYFWIEDEKDEYNGSVQEAVPVRG